MYFKITFGKATSDTFLGQFVLLLNLLNIFQLEDLNALINSKSMGVPTMQGIIEPGIHSCESETDHSRGTSVSS